MEHDPLGTITAELQEAMRIENDNDYDKYVELLENVQSAVLQHMAEASQRKLNLHRRALADSMSKQIKKEKERTRRG